MNAEPGAMGYREHRITVTDGLQLACRDYGDRLAAKTPVLCLSGLTRNAKDFDRLARRLAPQRRVLALDYRGRGRSDYDPKPMNYVPATYVRDVLDVTAATGVHRAVVIGTSLGGLVSMGLAVARPGMLAGVVLNDVGPEIPADAMARIGSYTGKAESFANWDEAVAEYKARYGLAHPDMDDAGWLRLAKDTFAEKDGRIVTDYDVRIVEPMKKGGALPDMWALFGALGQIPVLALRGELSDVLTQATFDKMAAAKPDLERVTVPRCGHVPTLEEPEVTGPLDAFLARIDAGGHA